MGVGVVWVRMWVWVRVWVVGGGCGRLSHVNGVPAAAVVRVKALAGAVIGDDEVVVYRVHLSLVARGAVLDVRDVPE